MKCMGVAISEIDNMEILVSIYKIHLNVRNPRTGDYKYKRRIKEHFWENCKILSAALSLNSIQMVLISRLKICSLSVDVYVEPLMMTNNDKRLKINIALKMNYSANVVDNHPPKSSNSDCYKLLYT